MGFKSIYQDPVKRGRAYKGAVLVLLLWNLSATIDARDRAEEATDAAEEAARIAQQASDNASYAYDAAEEAKSQADQAAQEASNCTSNL